MLTTKYTVSTRRRRPERLRQPPQEPEARRWSRACKRLNTDYIDVLLGASSGTGDTPGRGDDARPGRHGASRQGALHRHLRRTRPGWCPGPTHWRSCAAGHRSSACRCPTACMQRDIERRTAGLPWPRPLTCRSRHGRHWPVAGWRGRTPPAPTPPPAPGSTAADVSERGPDIARQVDAVADDLGATSSAGRARLDPGTPFVGASRSSAPGTLDQLTDNLASLELELPEEAVRRLDEASRIDLGFPQDFIEKSRDFVDGNPALTRFDRAQAVEPGEPACPGKPPRRPAPSTSSRAGSSSDESDEGRRGRTLRSSADRPRRARPTQRAGARTRCGPQLRVVRVSVRRERCSRPAGPSGPA